MAYSFGEPAAPPRQTRSTSYWDRAICTRVEGGSRSTKGVDFDEDSWELYHLDHTSPMTTCPRSRRSAEMIERGAEAAKPDPPWTTAITSGAANVAARAGRGTLLPGMGGSTA